MDFSWEFVLSAFVLILIVRSHKCVVYYFKFFYYCAAMTAVMSLLTPFFMFRPKNVLNFLASAAGVKHVSSVLGIKWTLRGSENLSKDRTCVLVANHQSSLDVQGMMDVWPVIRKMTAIAKRELMYTGGFGVGMYYAGLTYIDRSAGSKAIETMNNTMEDLKKKNIKLWVFPEGTRRNTGEIHPFKKGAFHSAIQAQVPIVPVVFSSYKHFLDTEKKIFDNGEIIITALPEISTVGLTANDVDSLIQRTRDLMIETYKATTREAQQKSKSE